MKREIEPMVAKSQPPEQETRERTSAPTHNEIAIAAYYLAEGRGFETGHENEDWRAAEAALSNVKVNGGCGTHKV